MKLGKVSQRRWLFELSLKHEGLPAGVLKLEPRHPLNTCGWNFLPYPGPQMEESIHIVLSELEMKISMSIDFEWRQQTPVI